MDRIEELGEVAREPTVERAVVAVRELLEMDLAYVSEHTDTEQVWKVVDGDPTSFNLPANGVRLPLEVTYCQQILAGKLPNLMPDIAAIPEAAAMPITTDAGVGAYVSVPVTLSDGSLYGTLCAAKHAANPALEGRDVQFLRVLARLVADQIERDRDSVVRERLQAEAAGVSALVAAVEARDSYTAEHSRMVVGLAGRVGHRLGLDVATIADVELVAMLHDIGKLAVPDHVLRKESALDETEWAVMHGHPVEGARIVESIPELARLAPAVRGEHEQWDGDGYPDGLAGEAIPIASRVVFVCDAYHAMTSDRPYRQALTVAAARDEIAAGSGTQFCPEAAKALLEEVPQV